MWRRRENEIFIRLYPITARRHGQSLARGEGAQVSKRGDNSKSNALSMLGEVRKVFLTIPHKPLSF